jgi:hypothetical protein
MNYFCCDQRRRDAVKADPTLNGIDFLEVFDDPNLPRDERQKTCQRTLFVHFLKSDNVAALRPENVRIEGGERITNVTVISARVENADPRLVVIDVSQPGDFSIYTLRLVRSAQDESVPENFDPLLATVDFSFKVECPSDFDCLAQRVCPPELRAEPEIDYLAKDYASFRRLMLDRISALVPAWTERNPADVGVAVVELLAYVGDSLSYRQDAVATEAYLGTARRRISARRHARLVDYRMHDGCNARAWIHVRVNAESLTLPAGRQFLTRVLNQVPRITPNSRELSDALAANPEVFESMHPVPLFAAHNELRFYTFGDVQCCLPKGATRAALRSPPTNPARLRNGDVLIFQEKLGPLTGNSVEADPMRRHAVRLTRVYPEASAVIQNDVETRTPGDPLNDPLTGDAYIEIEWAAEDALPFPFCISSKIQTGGGERLIEDISVALGNIVLADHGRTVSQKLSRVPVHNPNFRRVPAQRGSFCENAEEQEKTAARLEIFPRFNPQLDQGPVTQTGGLSKTRIIGGRRETQRLAFDPDASASAAFTWKMEDVHPAITLENAGTWLPRRDLLASDPLAREFVLEMESESSGFLRFGDDQHGRRPTEDTVFEATYRIGNGARGNVGAGSIFHIVSSDAGIDAITNPLATSGGIEPETIDEVRHRAPVAFRTQQRAVTATDYAEVAQRDSRVQRAAATFRWTGSWRTVFVTVDRVGGLTVDEKFKGDLRDELERYRMAGQDLEIDLPRFVSLEIELHVCVKPDYFRIDVEAALLEIFCNRILYDGRRGIFHPDNFSFGQPVFLSPIYAAAQTVDGVASVQVTVFQRVDRPGTEAIRAGKIELARLEIARLDNDPNFPERGVFTPKMEGGK